VTPATYKFLTDALVLYHFTFVAFMLLGGLLALRWRWVAWLHIPAVLWVIWVSASGSICPLTPLEQTLRLGAGMETYQGGFVDHYIMPVLYPEALTRELQFAIVGALLTLNTLSYGCLLYRSRRLRRSMRAIAPAPHTDAADPTLPFEPSTDNSAYR
jgi:hypothetical protein